MFRSVWKDPNNVEILRRSWLAGIPAQQIAITIGGGISRDAVIGKALRLKLPTHVHAGGNNPKRQPIRTSLILVLRELDECLDFANGWPACRCFPSTGDINKAFDAAKAVLDRVKDLY